MRLYQVSGTHPSVKLTKPQSNTVFFLLLIPT